MKFLHLIWRNAIRNKRRAVLTVLSLSIAIATIAILNTILHAFSAGVEVADEARLIVRNSTSLVFTLPLAYRDRISRVKGVKSVTVANWFGGTFQDKTKFFAKFAVEAETYFPMYPEIGVPPEQFQAFLKDRKGCLVGKKIAKEFDFKVGGTIPIIGDIFPGDWEFNVDGIYHGTKAGTDETTMFFHWKYLDESRPVRRQGQVGFYIVQLSDPDLAPSAAKTIDAEFENSPDQTLTETEKQFNLDFVRMMGNVQLLVRYIGGAVIFAILLVAANTMAMTARERTTEIAILKTVGFRNGLLSRLVVAEGLLLAVVAWGFAIGASWFVCQFVEKAFPRIFPVFRLNAETVVIALGVALFTGGISGLFPALHAARTTIVGAMRQVA
jgi:putative ABC transport system permease protein